MEENTVTNIEVRLKPQRSKMFVVSGYVHIQNKGKSNIFSLSDIVEVNNRFLNKEEKKLIGELKVIFQENIGTYD